MSEADLLSVYSLQCTAREAERYPPVTSPSKVDPIDFQGFPINFQPTPLEPHPFYWNPIQWSPTPLDFC